MIAVACAVPPAHADGGTITFSGAVVAPTCSAGGANVAAITSSQRTVSLRQRFSCGDASPGSAAAANSPTSYKLTVEPLDAIPLSTDRLVSYFSGYVRASQADARMNLVTQAYE